MKPLTEVINYTKAKMRGSVFPFYSDPLDPYLNYTEAMATGFYKQCSPELWAEGRVIKPYTKENVLADLKDYLKFAFMKAYQQRGLSAARSMMKIEVWLYMLDDEELSKKMETYEDYGIENLRAVDKKYFGGSVDTGRA